jgi:two-component system cell cycle sensor histidine kinase/response regulator CckA
MSIEEPSLFRALAVASPAAIFIVQGERLRYVNPAMESLTGYARGALLQMDPLELIDPDHREAAEERRRTRIHGALRLGRLEGRPALMGTAIDITDRKHLEIRMLQGERLHAVGRLAGGIAHDFNNLLLVITGQTERLTEGLRPGDPLLSAATAIAEAARRAASLTQQLLAFSQRQTLIARPLDLNEVITSLRDLLQSDLGTSVTLELDLGGGLPPVRADRTRIEQVLFNLTLNARDAMRGSGRLQISTDTVEVGDGMLTDLPWLRRGRFVRLRMRDTGVGISAEVQKHLFEPFFTTKSPGAGVGLGLASVYGIVKQSGGFVWLDGEPGIGACVTILLPPAEVAVEDVAPARTPVSTRPVVLLVEDEDAVRDLLTTVLQRGGFEVRAAGSAEAALAVDGTFDVLLTDVVLPHMTGPELARVMRERLPNVRILFMSGYTGHAVLEDSDFDAGRAFIQKPFGSKALVERIRELIDAPSPQAR